jgi:ABC-2 type transport system permease protein
MLPRLVARGSTETCDIQQLWSALDLDIDRAQIRQQSFPYLVWQIYNPYPRDPSLDVPELVIIRDETESGTDLRFGDHPATRGIEELLFQFTGYVRPLPNSSLEFSKLIETGRAGRILTFDFVTSQQNEQLRSRSRGTADNQFTLAAQIKGIDADRALQSDALKPSKSNTNVIYVCDVDLLADFFVDLRNNPIRNGIEYRFQDMSFVLNIIDSLLGDESYLELRNRKQRHVTLRVVEQTIEDAVRKGDEEAQQFEKEFVRERNAVQAKIDAELKPVESEIM